MSGSGSVLVALLCLGCAPDHGARQAPGASASQTLSVVDFGAKGDGQTLDTAAIQSAVDAVPPGGILRFPAGTYRIESDKGIELKDDVRLELGLAVIVAANVDGARSRLLEIEGRRNVVITGGTLVGSRSGSPQWGVGILASDAEDLLIENVTLRDFYFDGILLTGNRGCRRVVVRGVVAENNRRTGLAVPSAAQVTVENSSFRGTHGQSPEAGANFEPNAGGSVREVHVRGCSFTGNAGVGLYVHRAKGDAVSDVSVEDSVVEGNGNGIVMSSVEGVSIVNNRVSGHHREGTSGIVVAGTSRATVSGNRLEDNFRGILSGRATGVEIRQNTVIGMGAAAAAGASADANGIVCLGPSAKDAVACTVAANEVRRCASSGVVVQLVSQARIEDNTVEEVGQRGVLLRATSFAEVKGNTVATSGLAAPEGYAAIELVQSASDNLVSANTIRFGSGTQRAIAVCPACLRNRVTDNVVRP